MTEIVLTLVEDRIRIRSPYAVKDAIKALPERAWDGDLKLWSIPATPSHTLDFHRRFGDHKLLMDEGVTALLLQGREAAKASALKNAHDLPDLPTKTEAWSHQRQAFHFAKAQASFYLAMDMGTGKSLTAIALLEEHDIELAVIAGPRRALPVWPAQFREHARRDWHVVVPPLTASVQARAAAISQGVMHGIALKKPVAVCVNYEAYWRDTMSLVLKTLGKMQVRKALIFDEMHRIKAPGGKASKFALTLGKYFPIKGGLSGTPTPHSPLDIYAQYRALDTSIFGTSFSRFRGKYAVMGGFEGRQVMGYQNEADLATRMGSIMYVCKSDEVLDLPEYHHTEELVDLEPAARKAYNRLLNDFMTVIPDDPDAVVSTDNALTHLLRLQQCSAGWIKDDDGTMHRISKAKESLLSDVMEDLAPREPVVVFCRFRTDLDIIESVCNGQGRRYGELSGRVKEHHAHYALDGPKMREDIDVAGVQIQAGGVGIDLTRARYAIYYSMGYSLGDYEQSLKRIHRPGQTEPCVYIHLVARDTKDEAVYAALTARKNVVEAIIAEARKEKGT